MKKLAQAQVTWLVSISSMLVSTVDAAQGEATFMYFACGLLGM